MKDGGPAFPFILQGPRIEGDSQGMSLRDYFAAKAMHAMLNNDIRREQMATCPNVAKDAYRMANAMLAERERTTER